jgi:Transposase DDE domain group 1
MQFVLPLMAGFWHDYDCLEDIEKLETKPDMSHRFEGIPTARAIGDYLRDFEGFHLEKTNEYLTKQALAARKIFSPDIPLILDMDSTSHVQSGKQIEGLGQNYKGEICLDSLDSFDELGFCYGFRLREGGTFSSVGAGHEINRIFSHLSYKEEKHFRADSAYCNEEVITTCLRKNAFFTITAHGNTGWENKVSQVTNWVPWQYTEEEIEEAQKKKKKLPEIDVGSMLYQPSWSESLRFYIAIKRQRVEQQGLFEQEGFKYYGVMTNWNLFYSSPQKILEHHAKRGNSENFIREKKIHLDLRHFPCQKLRANFGYGLIAMVAYNFLRTIARLDNPDKPHYAKKLREKYLYIPARVTKHARQFFLKIPKTFRKEVDAMLSGWAGTLEAALAMS